MPAKRSAWAAIGAGRFYQLVDIAVDPAHQGPGLGKAIVGALMDALTLALTLALRAALRTALRTAAPAEPTSA